MAKTQAVKADHNVTASVDWEKVARALFLSRRLDDIEEQKLLPERKMFYQFSGRGHDLAQIILSQRLTHAYDAAAGYYRSRPLLLGLGIPLEEVMAATLMKVGGYSDGKDVGTVFNFPNPGGAKGLPMAGGVGTQYTPTAGWAQAIEYYRNVLKDKNVGNAIAVVLGGDASVATNGFWASLTIATTLKLPMLFYIEDNGYGISVPSTFQTPGANIALNLASFKNLTIFNGDGTDPAEAARLVNEATTHVRDRQGPALLRLTVPRLAGHSGQDTQAYKGAERIAEERTRDPLPKLKAFLVPSVFSEKKWAELEEQAGRDVQVALEAASNRPNLDTKQLKRHVFAEVDENGKPEVQQIGGLATSGHQFPASTEIANPQGPRINMVTAIRRTLEVELATNPKMVLFGEDVGPKGGVHAVTMGLQDKFGDQRVFDTSLSEEGIIGRAVGMAMAGLLPVPEIQFRKYAEPAVEQLNDCGTLRWRTGNRFAAPMVVRMAGGFSKCGDPWHSQTNEVQWVHAIGWKVAVPSNAEDAVGLLRAALRGNDPVVFFEHRAMLDHAWSRRPYPGDDYVVPFGKATKTMTGEHITLVAWGAMVDRCEEAAKASGYTADVIDLRTLMPWDKEAVLESVRKTKRCLVVHEDNATAGFGAEIVAVVSRECFLDLDAPPERLTMPDIPSPYNPVLLQAAVPGVDTIRDAIVDLVTF
ncbi:MAG: transketolase C-terminal domain-containing protein [Rhodospirillaceae bacterium]